MGQAPGPTLSLCTAHLDSTLSKSRAGLIGSASADSSAPQAGSARPAANARPAVTALTARVECVEATSHWTAPSVNLDTTNVGTTTPAQPVISATIGATVKNADIAKLAKMDFTKTATRAHRSSTQLLLWVRTWRTGIALALNKTKGCVESTRTVLEVHTDLSVTTGCAIPAQNVMFAVMASITRADPAETRHTTLRRFACRSSILMRLVPLVVEVTSVEIRCKDPLMVNKTESAALQER